MRSKRYYRMIFTGSFMMASLASIGQQLLELCEISALPSYREGYCAQISSYDTTGGNDDGFSGRFSYLRSNPDGTLVIFEVEGPGVINRIWTPTPSDDSLDFYIDDYSKPLFTICYRDLFSGSVFPFVAPLCGNQLGGYYCYFPIPFGERCRIVYRGEKTQFHQIQYRLYSRSTRVKRFNPGPDQAERECLQQIQKVWTLDSFSVTNFYPATKMLHVVRNFPIVPGQTVQVAEIRQGGRIMGIEVNPAKAFSGYHKYIDIRITWDDEKMPAVYCPIADFFGYAFGRPSMKSLLIGTAGERNYSFFPMPFDKSARVEFIYREPGDGGPLLPLDLETRIFYSDQARDIQKEGKFYCYWNRNNPARKGQPHIFLNVKGKGHYVGTVLQAQGLQPGMTYFFEGDDSTAVDGQFRMHGTGSEDYFNGGWYALPDRWDAAMSLPLSGALDYSLPFCRTGGYRLFLADKISFEKSFFHSIEHGPVNNAIPADYTSVSYYYCSSPGSANPPPDGRSSDIYMPDTLVLYPQLTDLGILGEISVRPEWAYPTGGETFFCRVADGSGLRISLREIPAGNYRLFLDYVQDPEGCSFSLWQRQTQLSGLIDGYNPQKIRNGRLFLSKVRVDEFLRTVTIRFRTQQDRNMFIFNRLILKRI